MNSDLPENLIGTDFKDRYPFTCPVTGKEFDVKPSILMAGFGMNRGGVSCSCGAYHAIRLNANERMELLPAEVIEL